MRRLGAAAPGGLALPAADPTPSHSYSPRGVWTDGDRVVVADSGNHRVLVWHHFPEYDGAPADVVLGQPDFFSEGPAAGQEDVARGLYLPTGVGVVDGNLVVADAWHHRVLMWEGVPTENFTEPSVVIGQRDLSSIDANRGGEPGLDTLYWPFGFAVVGETFWVADTGNRRVLGWRGGIPMDGRPADVLLGQSDPSSRQDNAGALGSDTFRWPHAISGDDRTLFVADAGNHRVVGFDMSGTPSASVVLGQAEAAVADEFKNRPQGAHRLRFPYAVVNDEDRLVVADTSNNRVLLWHGGLPRSGFQVLADTVLGQVDFDANGENRWDAVADDSLCWPYGLSLAGNRLAVADSGNNRVVIWEVT